MNKIDQYISAHSSVESPVLQELTRQTHLRAIHPRMLSGHVQGQLLSMLTSIIAPTRVLELGTFTAYSTICIATSMAGANAELVTIEIDDELESIAADFILRAGVQNVVRQVIGDALDVMPTLGGKFDLIFIDADKRSYVEYYKALWDNDLLHTRSVILADNTLWDGKVVEEVDKKDSQTIGIMAFNDMIARDQRVEKVILPLRDGLTMIRVK